LSTKRRKEKVVNSEVYLNTLLPVLFVCNQVEINGLHQRTSCRVH